MHLAIDLLRMAPNRFEPQYRKIYRYVESYPEVTTHVDRSLQALYFLLIRQMKITDLPAFIK